MRLSHITATEVGAQCRIDAKFHISRQNPLLRRLYSGKWPLRTIADQFGQDNVWSGNIFSRVYAQEAEFGKPLLVPYDLFRYVPWSDKILSKSQVPQFEKLQIRRGCLFIVCSGRNLGPVTLADAFCARFAMSHDMVRISVEPTDELFFLAAFLSTAYGQAAIRTDMNGSVIDHTDENQIGRLRYPIVREELRKFCAGRFKKGFETREKARLLIADTSTKFLEHFGLNLTPRRLPKDRIQRRFTITRAMISDRLDAEPFAPVYDEWRSRIQAAGGVPLKEIAEVTRPFGRYRMVYVTDERYGIRMMNGRQVAHYRPIALRCMSRGAMKSVKDYVVSAGTTLLTADGRAEENLADCAFVEYDRDGWAASVHVHRVKPRNGVHPGLVYLACACAPVQAQLKALATGSVVDALSATDVESVIVPYSDERVVARLGDRAVEAWRLFAEATAAEDEAIAAMEREFDL